MWGIKNWELSFLSFFPFKNFAWKLAKQKRITGDDGTQKRGVVYSRTISRDLQKVAEIKMAHPPTLFVSLPSTRSLPLVLHRIHTNRPRRQTRENHITRSRKWHQSINKYLYLIIHHRSESTRVPENRNFFIAPHRPTVALPVCCLIDIPPTHRARFIASSFGVTQCAHQSSGLCLCVIHREHKSNKHPPQQ
jgi:hypothetical protein